VEPECFFVVGNGLRQAFDGDSEMVDFLYHRFFTGYEALF